MQIKSIESSASTAIGLAGVERDTLPGISAAVVFAFAFAASVIPELSVVSHTVPNAGLGWFIDKPGEPMVASPVPQDNFIAPASGSSWRNVDPPAPGPGPVGPVVEEVAVNLCPKVARTSHSDPEPFFWAVDKHIQCDPPPSAPMVQPSAIRWCT